MDHAGGISHGPDIHHSYILSTHEGQIVKGPFGIEFRDIPDDLSGYISGRIYFGKEADTAWYVACIISPPGVPPGYSLVGLRELFGTVQERLLGIACRAVQLARFDTLTRFCGYCGSRTRMKQDEIARVCTACGKITFPRLSPAVIVRITDDRRILLSRSPPFTRGMYSIQAGFVEPGESLEATVHREVREEVGISVKNLRYFASQPWPFPDSLMIGFTAEYAGGEIRIDGQEIEDAQWFTREKMPDLPGPFSIAGALIQDWLNS
ncbi:MAG: NAD(+) diphosphatase [Methanospirillum sp.]|nr:NAD(+) diphosphatase [Methanospirillum sp.]